MYRYQTAGRVLDAGGPSATAEGYASVIDDRARLVSVPLVSSRHGPRLPVAEHTPQP